MKKLIIGVLVALSAGLAMAQDWPSKPIRLIAVFPPGGSVDQVARILAEALRLQLNQTVVVENIGGASGAIGTAAVARSAPDGYTFGVVFDTHAVNPGLKPNMGFDTLGDLEHVTLIGTAPMVLAATKGSPHASFTSLVQAARTTSLSKPMAGVPYAVPYAVLNAQTPCPALQALCARCCRGDAHKPWMPPHPIHRR